MNAELKKALLNAGINPPAAKMVTEKWDIRRVETESGFLPLDDLYGLLKPFMGYPNKLHLAEAITDYLEPYQLIFDKECGKLGWKAHLIRLK